MSTKHKNWVRLAVAALVLAWPGVETCRLMIAKKQLAASQELRRSVEFRVAQAKSMQVAGQPKQP